MTENHKRNLLNGNRVAPWKILSIQNVITLAAVFAVLVGMLYLFEGQNEEQARDENRASIVRSSLLNSTDTILENQDKQTQLLTTQVERGNVFRNQSQQFNANLLTRINDTVSEVLARDANLTREEQKEVIDDIRTVFNTTIPEVYNTLSNINQTLDEIRQSDVSQQNRIFFEELINNSTEQVIGLLQNTNISSN